MWAGLAELGVAAVVVSHEDADHAGGARSVLSMAYVARVDVDDRSVIRDIDTPADLAEIH